MSTTTLDLQQAAAHLEAAGWDVTVADVLEAWHDGSDVPGVWTLFVDTGGRVRFVAQRFIEQPETHRVEQNGRSYRVLRERSENIQITTTLTSADDIAIVLSELAALAHQPAFHHSGDGPADG